MLARRRLAPCKRSAEHHGKQPHMLPMLRCNLHGGSGPGTRRHHLAGLRSRSHPPVAATRQPLPAVPCLWRARLPAPSSPPKEPPGLGSLLLRAARHKTPSFHAAHGRIASRASGRCGDGMQCLHPRQKAWESSPRSTSNLCQNAGSSVAPSLASSAACSKGLTVHRLRPGLLASRSYHLTLAG